MVNAFNIPDPHEMDPHTGPTEGLLEFYCRISCFQFIGIDGTVKAIDPVATYSWSKELEQDGT